MRTQRSLPYRTPVSGRFCRRLPSVSLVLPKRQYFLGVVQPSKPNSFYINPGANTGLQLQVQATVNSVPGQTAVQVPSSGVFAANTWTQVNVPLSSLGVAGATINGFWIQVSLTWFSQCISFSLVLPRSLPSVSLSFPLCLLFFVLSLYVFVSL